MKIGSWFIKQTSVSGLRLLQLLAACFVVVVTVAACSNDSADERKYLEFPTEAANKVAGKTLFIQDTRLKHQCFAYYREGNWQGGPALTTIPCSAIPPHMLVKTTIPAPPAPR